MPVHGIIEMYIENAVVLDGMPRAEIEQQHYQYTE